jgi:PPM family protein phosphatase
MNKAPGIEFASLTDIGCQRERNEDSSAYWEPDSEDGLERRGRLAVIADGMGGYEGGQEASRIAVQTICETYADTGLLDHQIALVSSVRAAHERIQEYAIQHPELFGMGTTCTALSVVHSQLHYAHVGDSRLYLIRHGSISQLTRDHSYVARLVMSGVIRPEEAELHPQRHILTAALGVGEQPLIDTPEMPVALEPGDVLLLCTDGLWGIVSNDELRKFANSGSPSEACRQLVQLANQRGGPDNITVQVLRFSGNGAGHLVG